MKIIKLFENELHQDLRFFFQDLFEFVVKGHADQQREIECPVCEGCCSGCSGYYVSSSIGSHDKKLDRLSNFNRFAMIGLFRFYGYH